MELPEMIRVEAATACQLRCPLCDTTRGKVHPYLGRGFLSAADFARLLDESPWVKHVELSNWGEIFLNPELVTIVQLAHDRGVTLSADNGVNFNRVAPGVLAALVKYGFRSLAVSLDGATPEVYRHYRVGGDLARVLGNVRELNRLKAEAHSEFPLLTWQFIVFGHNEHELERAREMANELGMAFRLKLAGDDIDTFSPLKDREAVRAHMPGGVVSRAEFYAQHGERYLGHAMCRQLWDSPQINYDGKVLGCCLNAWGDFGNAFTDGLETVLDGEKMRYAKKMLQGKAKPRAGIPCTDCSYYRTMREDKKFLPSERASLLTRIKNRIGSLRFRAGAPIKSGARVTEKISHRPYFRRAIFFCSYRASWMRPLSNSAGRRFRALRHRAGGNECGHPPRGPKSEDAGPFSGGHARASGNEKHQAPD